MSSTSHEQKVELNFNEIIKSIQAASKFVPINEDQIMNTGTPDHDLEKLGTSCTTNEPTRTSNSSSSTSARTDKAPSSKSTSVSRNKKKSKRSYSVQAAPEEDQTEDNTASVEAYLDFQNPSTSSTKNSPTRITSKVADKASSKKSAATSGEKKKT